MSKGVQQLLLDIGLLIVIIYSVMTPTKLPSYFWLGFIFVGMTSFIFHVVDYLRRHSDSGFINGLIMLNITFLGLSKVFHRNLRMIFSYITITFATITLGLMLYRALFQNKYPEDITGDPFKIYLKILGLSVAAFFIAIVITWLLTLLFLSFR